MCLDIIFYICQERSGEVTIFGKIIAIFEVDKGGFGGDGGVFGFLMKLDKGLLGLGKVVVGNVGGGGAEDAGNLGGGGHEASKAECGIARGIFLIIGAFVSLIDDNEAKIVDGRDEGGTGTDDNTRLTGIRSFENVKPGAATFGHGLLRVNEVNVAAEGLLEDRDELAGEGDFWDEKNGGLVVLEGVGGEFEVDVGFAAAGDAEEEASEAGGLLKLGKSARLGGIEGNGGG